MKIITESLIEGAKKSKGLVVIIDVFRAFTTAAYVMHNGAKRIIPVGNIEDSFALKKEHPDYILMGERGGLKVNGFDYGNSPSDIKDIDFTGKTVIMTTSSGTQGIVNSNSADEIITGSFVNVGAIIDYIKRQNPEIVTLVAMGNAGIEVIDEDELCAKYIKESLEDKDPCFAKIREHLKSYKSAAKFFDKNKPEFPEGDFDCAMAINKFNFVLKVVKNGENIEIVKA